MRDDMDDTERVRVWREANPEKYAAQRSRYREKNREKLAVKQRARYAADPEKGCEIAARHRVDNPQPRGAGPTGRTIRTPVEVAQDLERGSKFCTKCGEDKSFSDFHKQKSSPDGVNSVCKFCVVIRMAAYREVKKADGSWVAARRAVYLRHRFNLSVQQYDDLYSKQLGVCLGCLESLDEVKICVDHDHSCCPMRSCGKCVRGLLCDNCNQALGRVRDDAATLLRLASYITGD